MRSMPPVFFRRLSLWLKAGVIVPLIVLSGVTQGLGPTRPTAAQTLHVPILMYHYIRVNPVASDKVGFSLSVTPSDFSAQMALLFNRGAHTITFDDLFNSENSGAALPSNPIILTFDDGYADFATTAVPVLRQYGFTAVNYVVSGFIGRPNYMSLQQLQQVSDQGMVIGDHTVHHVSLAGLSNASQWQEINDARNQLRKWTSQPVLDFCYPNGSNNSQAAANVAKAGMRSATTTVAGAVESSGNAYTMPRTRVSGGETISAFSSAIPQIQALPPAPSQVTTNTRHPDGTLIRVNGGTFWIQNGARCTVGSMAVLQSHNIQGWEIKNGTTPDAALPNNCNVYFRNGALLKGQSSPNVYVVQVFPDGSVQKRLITSIQFFTGLGYNVGDIVNVPDSNLSAPDGPTISDGSQHPDGTVVRDASNGAIFEIGNGSKRYVHSMDVYKSQRFVSSQTKVATPADLSLPAGSDLQLRDGTLVKGSTPTVYVVHQTDSGLEKHAFMSLVTFSGLGFSSQDVIQVSDAELPTANGPAIYLWLAS